MYTHTECYICLAMCLCVLEHTHPLIYVCLILDWLHAQQNKMLQQNFPKLQDLRRLLSIFWDGKKMPYIFSH